MRVKVNVAEKINDSIVKPAARSLYEEIIAEIDQLEAKWKRIEDLDILVGNVNHCDVDVLDTLTAAMDCIENRNCADLDLDSLLDAVNHVINNVRGTGKKSGESTGPMRPEDREFLSLKSQVERQQVLISELQGQLKSLNASGMNPQRSFEEIEQQLPVDHEIEIGTPVQAKTADNGIVEVENLGQLGAEVRMENDGFESGETHALECDRSVITTPSEQVEVDNESPSYAERESIHLPGTSKKKKQLRGPSKKGRLNSRRRTIFDERNRSKSTGTDAKLFSCDECRRSFSFKSNLTRHLMIHSGEKPFKCNVCEKSFSQKGILARHLLIHTSEKPFVCDICQMSFRHKVSLSDHWKTIHTGSNPYKCKVCERSFNQKSSLTSHLRIHTGEKPYKCDVCEKSFKYKGNLTTHSRTHSK